MKKLVLALLFPAMTFGLVIGCGEFGGGASVVPEAVLLPAEYGEAVESGDVGSEVVEATAAGAAQTGGVGTFHGHVRLVGSVPALPLPPLIKKGDSSAKDSGSCAADDVPNQKLIVSGDNGVANVFIYLAKAPKGVPFELDTEKKTFDQKVCTFEPHCMVVHKGQPVSVLNGDAVSHNTHTYPSRNEPFNGVVSANDRVGNTVFKYTKAEKVPVQVKCDYHTWMIAYQLPVDHPFAIVTDENGHFEIPNLPAGKYEFVVWHEAAGYVYRKFPVNVTGGENTATTIEYPADKVEL